MTKNTGARYENRQRRHAARLSESKRPNGAGCDLPQDQTAQCRSDSARSSDGQVDGDQTSSGNLMYLDRTGDYYVVCMIMIASGALAWYFVLLPLARAFGLF
jgi:hypothetical protein